MPTRDGDRPLSPPPAAERLLADLSRARIGSTFNQYRDVREDDVADAPAIRLANLRFYLGQRRDAEVLAIGEAVGYQGMRWSGIAFTSERDLARWGPPFRPTCATRPRGWSEPSGTIVHRVLERAGAERRVVLWNTVPTHPHQPGNPLSNRRPTLEEIQVGAEFARRLIRILRPTLLVAVGRVAQGVMGDQAVYVRHPANAGGTLFAAGLRAVLARLDSG